MINILHVIPNLKLAGAETMCSSLVMELSKTPGYNVSIASLYDIKTPLTKKLENSGIKVYYIGKKSGIDISMIWKLYQIIHKNKIQVIHTHLYVMQYVIPAAILARVKVRIHTVHNIAKEEFRKPQRILANIFYRISNVVPVAISPIVKSTVLEEYRLSSEDVPMIYNGGDITRCVVKDDYSTPNKIKILHVGRLTDVKNQTLIIQAVRKLTDKGYNLSLDLYGAGENQSMYKGIIKSLSLEDSVHLKGLIDNIYPVMHAADIFVLPSKYEGMPMTLIEAMGTGLPIIASCVGGIPDMIDNNKEGILIVPILDALVDALEKLINNCTLRKELGQNARLKALAFSSKVMADNYSKLYEEQMWKK